jgi:putative hydrolase of the HAD superfamily
VAIRAVLFDLFDTLVDLHYERIPRDQHAGRPVPPTARALHAAVRECADVDFERFLEAVLAVDAEFREGRHAEGRELPTEERFAAVIERLGLAEAGLAGTLTLIHMDAIRRHTEVPEHHGALLAELEQRVRIGLCSNFSHSPTALDILEGAGIQRHFHAIVISDAVGIRKPRGEIFHAALERLEVAPDEVLHVGDSLRADVGGAAAVGIPTVWITRRVRDPERWLRAHEGPAPDFVIRDLAEVRDLLDAGPSAAGS